MTRVRADAAIGELAARQHGVVARWQLAAIPVSPSMIRARVAAGALIRLHPGVYAVGHRQLRTQGHRLAAVLAIGPGAALSHRDAAALHGLRPSNRTRVDVTTARRVRRPPPGIEVHHTTTLEPDDIATVDGIPVTTVERTLVDLANVVPKDHLAKALREADHLRVADLRMIHDVMERTRNRPGRRHANLKAILEEHRILGTQLTRSPLEDRFISLLDANGLPRARMNAAVAGHEVDAFWPRARLVVELDGYARHKDRHAFQRDRDKANALTEAGYTVLRFTHADVVHDSAETARRIRTLLADL